MDRQSLSVSPVAELIVRIAEQRESCSLQLADRRLRIVAGELVDVSATDSDLELPEFLVRSGRLRPEQRDLLAAQATRDGMDPLACLRAQQLVPEVELRAQQRALWLERVTRALRKHGLTTPAEDCRHPLPEEPPAGAQRVRLVPLLLDALSRLALDGDASEIGRRLDQRLSFKERAAAADARRWASFGELPDRPVVAALLARLPASAPYMAALVLAGLAGLEAPGGQRAVKQPVPTLPPPPSRFSRLPLINWSSKPQPGEATAAVSGRRIRLEPGGAGDRIDAIPEVALVAWPKRLSPLVDPLREPELLLGEETDPERRAQLFESLAELWRQRIGSHEEAARNLREAAAAQPDSPTLLLMAAEACAHVGHGEVALRYAGAALPLSSDPTQRAAAQRLLAHLHERLEQHDLAVFVLTEAASEHTGAAWPHERLAQIAQERDQLALARAHLRAAASAERVRAPRRALAMYALAYGWDGSDGELATEYADALQALGHPEAAIAILAQSARVREPVSRELLGSAARRAQQHARSDLAVELWLELLVQTPQDAAAWDALEACLGEPEQAARLAAVRESRVRQARDAAERGERLSAARRSLDRFPAEQPVGERYARLAQLGALPEPGSELDPRAEASRVRRLARRAETAETQQPLLRQLAALYVEAGEPRGVVSACLELLALDAADPLAAARMWLAGLQLTDAVGRSEALTMLARVHAGRARARVLAQLAREQERLHDFDAALGAAEASLFLDASGADAVLIALGHLHRGTPERALTLLAQAQRSLAAPPAVLLATADAAAAAGDQALARRALSQLLEHLPEHAPARCLLLESQLADEDASAIETSAQALLMHGSSPQLDRHAHAAVERLAALAEPAAAAELAEQLLARCGRLDPELADHAYELAHASGDGALQIRALERAASAHSGAARAACLFQLATRHSAAADRVAELRALLRAAALPEGRTRALELLSQRFAEQGDGERLLTVLSLRLDAASGAPARRQLLFELACAAVSFSSDRARALGFVRSMLAESQGDREALLHCLGAVFALGDAAWALSAARELALEQPAEVAGALFLWLAHRAEHADDGAELALSLALEGAERYPATGELLLMAERLTLARGDKSGALALYAALLAGSSGAHGQRALHYRAGRWLERFGAPLEALDHYQQAFDLSPSAGVAFSALVRCARSAGKLEVLLSAQHQLSLLASSDRQRTSLLSAAAELALRELCDPARALELLLEAEAFIPLGELDPLVLEAARLAGPGESEAALRELVKLRAERIEQLWDRDAKADALLGLSRLLATGCADPLAAASTLRGLLEGELAEQLSAPQREQVQSEYARLSRELSPVQPSAAPAAPSASASGGQPRTEDELRALAQTGDAEALCELVPRLNEDPACAEEAFALLSQLVRGQPQRTAALRELAVRARSAGAAAQARICEQVLSVFDASYTAQPRLLFGSRELPPEELWLLLAPERTPGLSRLLDLIWQHARLLPQLRPAARWEALGEAATPSDERTILSAFARVTSLLGRAEAVLHVKSNVAQDVSALPGPPATLVVRAGSRDAPALEFQLARALVACEPEHALVTALNERAARRLFTAVNLAFGLPGAQTALSLSDRALALQLRATVGKPTQLELRQLLVTHADELDYAALRLQTDLAAVRAGLLVSGDVRTSLLTLARMQPRLSERDVTTEAGYTSACLESPAFAELVRCALSLPFIGLTDLALPQHLEESAE